MGVRSDSTPNVPQFTAPGETPPSYTIHAYNTIESYQAFGCVIKDYTLECKAEQLCTQNITFLHHKTDNITPDWTAPTAIVYNTAVRQHFSDVAIVINGYNISDLFMKGFTLKITNEFHPTVILDGYYRKAPVLKSRNITMDVEFEANASDFQIDRFAALPTEFGVAVKLGTTDSEVIKTYWNNMCVDSIDWQPLSDPGEVYTYKMGLKNGAGFSYTDGIHNGESKVDKTINITISA